MQRSAWWNWGLVVVFLTALVLIFWLVFDRPLGQTVVSGVVGLFVGIASVWWRGRRRV